MANERVNVIYTADVKQLENRLRKIEGVSDEAAAGIADAMGSQFEAINKSAQQMSDQLLDNFGAIGQGLKGLVAAAGPVGLAIGAALAVTVGAAALAGKAIFDLSSEFSEWVDETVQGAAAMGLTENAFIALERTARRAGAELNDFKEPLKALVRQMGLAADGTQSSIDKFDALGISATDSTGAMRPMEDVLADLVQATDAMETPAEKASAAMSLMGESGAKVTAALSGQSELLRETIAETEALNLVTEEAKEQSAKWDLAMGQLQDATQNITLALGEEFIPILNDVLTDLVIVVEEVSKFRKQLAILGRIALEVATADLPALAESLKNLAADWKAAGTGAQQWGRDQKAVTVTLQTLGEETDENTGKTDENTRSRKRNTEAMGEQLSELDKIVLSFIEFKAVTEEDLLPDSSTLSGFIEQVHMLSEELAGLFPSASESFGNIQEMIGGMIDGVIAGGNEAVALGKEQLADYAVQAKDLAIGALVQISELTAGAARKTEQELRSLGTDATEAERKELEERLKQQKKTAKAAFGIQKVVRIAEATIAGAAMFAKTMGDFGFPWGLVPAGIGLGIVAGQIATIASTSPSFHDARRLSIPSAAPDEVPATLLRGERVIGARTLGLLGGDSGVDALNRGDGGRGMRGGPTIFQYEHRSFSDFSRDNLRLPGSPLWAAQADPLLGRHG